MFFKLYKQQMLTKALNLVLSLALVFSLIGLSVLQASTFHAAVPSTDELKSKVTPDINE